MEGEGNMSWIFSSEKPIFKQIADHICVDIINGIYKPGERIPSVRELALAAAVNPNTMQKGLSELEEWGLLISQSTSGRYVTNDNELISKVKLLFAKELCADFLSKTSRIGLTPQEAKELLNSELNI